MACVKSNKKVSSEDKNGTLVVTALIHFSNSLYKNPSTCCGFIS
jgi:hypothetical protein